MTMTREEILETLKELILSLINDKELFAKDAANWKNKQVTVGVEIDKLSSEDRTWIEEEYEKWYAQSNFPVNIEPNPPKTT